MLRSLCLAFCLSFLTFTSLAAEPVATAAKIIAQLKMQKIPVEGPWFTVTYKSTDTLAAKSLPNRYRNVRSACTAIYCLITPEDFSAMHRLKTDEIWHFYSGDPLKMLLLYPNGKSETVILGPDILRGQRPQVVVPRGVWQGAIPLKKSKNAYTLFGCTLAPGFEYEDFEVGYRAELAQKYPAAAASITELTRSEYITRPKP